MPANRKIQEKRQEAPSLPQGRSFWSGTLAFGLVSIPVDFYAAQRSRAARLRMVTSDGHPVGRRYVCPRDQRPVSTEDLVRGLELESGEIVAISDDELQALAPERTREIDLKRFVPVAELPSLLFERAYVLAPSGESPKAYRLLAEVMEHSGKAGIATFVMRDKAYVIAIIGRGGLLHAETLRFVDELRTPIGIGLPTPVKVSSSRMRQVALAMDELAEGALDPDELEDEYGEKLTALALKKAKNGQDVFVPEDEAEGESEVFEAPVDLVALLKQRLEASGTIAARQSEGAAPAREVERGEGNGKPKDGPDLAQNAKSDLYARAKKLGIEGRSRMSKKDLVAAIHKAAG